LIISFEFWSLDIVSDFGFSASNLDPFHFVNQSRRALTWPSGPGFPILNKPRHIRGQKGLGSIPLKTLIKYMHWCQGFQP